MVTKLARSPSCGGIPIKELRNIATELGINPNGMKKREICQLIEASYNQHGSGDEEWPSRGIMVDTNKGVHYLDLTCVENAGYMISDKIGEPSAYGTIYITCTIAPHNCQYIIKVDISDNEDKWEKEIAATVLAGEEGLGPKVQRVLECTLCNVMNHKCQKRKLVIMKVRQNLQTSERN
jgi:hypothetical protein